jgi:alpha-beta hydrolase superfamily lysophospholipase
MRAALGALLYFPSREILQTPADAGLAFEELRIDTEDGERLHAWLVAGQAPAVGRIVLCHGNAGNIGDRVLTAALLSAAGFEVLLFDYRGYGLSSGKPDEEGTYRDARAALAALSERPGHDRDPLFYLGESLGGAIALKLALESPPRGLILQSTFTSIRQAARHHYPFIPPPLVPDAYPSLRAIAGLRAPLLVLHGDRDELIPLAHGRALLDAAPEPKQLHVFAGSGHNDLIERAGREYARVIADWASSLNG